MEMRATRIQFTERQTNKLRKRCIDIKIGWLNGG
jgi:hypothetical protein